MPLAVDLTQRLDPYADGFRTIGRREFQRILAVSKGSRIVTITSLTVPDYRKTLKMMPGGLRIKERFQFSDNINKLARTNGIVNWQYGSAVNRQRIREGKSPDFEPLPRQWGTRLNKSPFVAHVNKQGENKLYLEVKVEKVVGVEYLTNDGETIPIEIVEPYLNPDEGNPRQWLDEEVVLRDFDVNNILAIVIDGKGYVIE